MLIYSFLNKIWEAFMELAHYPNDVRTEVTNPGDIEPMSRQTVKIYL